jgi:ribose transport system permease protein
VRRRILDLSWLGAVIFALALLVANVVVRPSFAPTGSWPDEFATFAPFALAAMASTPAVLSGGGGLDLSIGPLLNFASVLVVAVLLPHHVDGAVPVIAIALACGLVVGLINGILVAVLRFQPILATLCGLFVLQGLGLAVRAAPQPAHAPWLHALGDKVGPVPGGLILIAAPLLVWGALALTPFLGLLRAVGHDDVAAFSAGVPVRAVRIASYALGGVFAALGGIALAAVTGSANPSEATQYTLPAIAAVAIGGTSLLGGRGSMFGSLVGAAIMYLAQTLLDSARVSEVWLQVIYGALLILAIVASSRMAALRPLRGRLA